MMRIVWIIFALIALSLGTEFIFWKLLFHGQIFGAQQWKVTIDPSTFELMALNIVSSLLIIASFVVFKKGLIKSIIAESVLVEILYTLLFLYVILEVYASVMMFVLSYLLIDFSFG